MRKEKIMKRMQEHLDFYLKNYKNDWVYITLVGSQNYELDYSGSDIDTKIVILPNLEDIVLGRPQISTTLLMENEEHVDVKDIRQMFQTYRKQNINYLETLFTEFKIINPKYEELIKPIFENRELIAHYDINTAINCMCGMAMEKRKALCHPYPTIIDKIEKYGYDCYTEDTKFLTLDGWKFYDEIVDGEKIGTMNPQTHNLEFQVPSGRIKKHTNNKIFKIETVDSCFKITENHNVYLSNIKNINKYGHKYISENSNWQLIPLKEAKEKQYHKHLISFPNNNNNDYDITDEELIILGGFVSEGTVNFRDKEQKNVKGIRISQTKNGKKDFFEMMDKTTLKKIETEKETIWTSGKEIGEKMLRWSGHGSKNKKLPSFIYSLSLRQAKLLLKMLLLGDGSFYANRDIYYTSSKRLAEDILSLCYLAGTPAVVMGGQEGYCSNGNFGKVNMYQVAIKNKSLNPFYVYCKENKNIEELKDYKDNVVCFEVDNGLLVTMQNGKTAVQGNCKQLHHIARMRDFLERYINGEKFETCLIPTDKGYLLDLKTCPLNLSSALSIADMYMSEIKELKENFRENNYFEQNHSVEVLLTKVLKNVIIYNIEGEVLRNIAERREI